jgi:hypothetical protein
MHFKIVFYCAGVLAHLCSLGAHCCIIQMTFWFIYYDSCNVRLTWLLCKLFRYKYQICWPSVTTFLTNLHATLIFDVAIQFLNAVLYDHWQYSATLHVQHTSSISYYFMLSTAVYHTTSCTTHQRMSYHFMLNTSIVYLPVHAQHISRMWYQFMFNTLADIHCAEHFCHISCQFILIISAVYCTISCLTHQQHFMLVDR